MIQALYTASTGMLGVQKQIDVTANNIANVNTVGFKKARSEFADLIYKNVTKNKNGMEIGLGVKTTTVSKIFSQGSLKQTGNILDIAIKGKGFFKLQLPDGTEVYSRNGTFKIDKDGFIVNSNGYKLIPEIKIPTDSTKIHIDVNGAVSVKTSDQKDLISIGEITISNFINPNTLHSLGDTLYTKNSNSSREIVGTPGSDNFGLLKQGFVELSNVKLVVELTDLITAQRAYEANSKVIKTGDKMLQILNNIKATVSS